MGFVFGALSCAFLYNHTDLVFPVIVPLSSNLNQSSVQMPAIIHRSNRYISYLSAREELLACYNFAVDEGQNQL